MSRYSNLSDADLGDLRAIWALCGMAALFLILLQAVAGFSGWLSLMAVCFMAFTQFAHVFLTSTTVEDEEDS